MAGCSVDDMTVTLITGANKGLGHETARQLSQAGHTVYIGARDPGRGQSAPRGQQHYRNVYQLEGYT